MTKRSSNYMLMLGFLLVVAGPIIGVWLLFSTETYRFTVPGMQTLMLPKAGKYIIYYETSMSGGQSATLTYPAPPRPRVLSVESGATVPVQPLRGNETYQFGDRKGTSIYSFTIPRSGRYELRADSPSGPRVTWAVQQSRWGSMLAIWFGAWAVGGPLLGYYRQADHALGPRLVGRPPA